MREVISKSFGADREHGVCTECGSWRPMTRDNLCVPCVQEWIDSGPMQDAVRDLNKQGTEEIGRPRLGGANFSDFSVKLECDADEYEFSYPLEMEEQAIYGNR